MKTKRYALTVAGLAAAYLVTGQLGLLFPYHEAFVAIIWPAAGVALAAILLGGYRLWPGITLGAGTLALINGQPLTVIATSAFASTLTALAAVWLLEHWARFNRRLERVQDVLALSVLGGLVPSGIGATAGALIFIFTGDIERISGWTWLTWWLGDTAGVLLVTPVILLWGGERRSPSPDASAGEIVTAFVLLGIACGISFNGLLPSSELNHLPLAFVPFPFLIWIAMRLDMRWVAAAVLLTVCLSIIGTALGYGPFARASTAETLAVLWSFAAIAGLTALLLGAGRVEYRRAQERFRLAVESNPNAIVLVNPQGEIVLVNAQTESFFGYKRQELIGQPVEMLVPETVRSQHAQHRTAYTAKPNAQSIGDSGRDLYALRKDNSEFPVEIALTPIEADEDRLVLSAISDITKRKEAESALQHERDFLSSILQTVGALVMVTDRQQRIVHFNPACEKASGYRFAEVKGRTTGELGLLPAGQTEPDPAQDTLQQDNEPANQFESYWVAKDGTRRLIAWSNTVLRDTHGDIKYIIATGIDITEHRAAEAQARQWQAELAHIDRQAIASEMASGIAHEINQPLTAISTYAQACRRLIANDKSDPDDIERTLNKISAQALHAGDVINRLRRFIKKRDGERKHLDCNELISEVIQLADVSFHYHAMQIQLELSPEPAPVVVDPVQIQQVVLNLIRNAMEAMENSPDDRKVVELRTSRHGNQQFEVAVTDHGNGITEETAEQVFNSFFTTKASGTGLGLAISHSIIAAHGGQLGFTRNPEGGTTFHFTLPLANADECRR